MRFGLALPHYDFSFPDPHPVGWSDLVEWAKRAEELGFDSVWVSDHFFLSIARYGGGDERHGTPEPLAALAGLAEVTDRVRLGTLVLCSSFRHPALVAKAATTIDLLSGGRLDLGVGAGWYEEEFRAFGFDFPGVGERFEVLEETVTVLAHLFGEGPSTWEGRHFRLEGAYNRPRPVQEPRPPIWVGGKGGPRLLRLVARLADGWNTVWSWSPEAYGERVEALREACEREGRDPGTVRRSLGFSTLVGESEADLADRFRALQAWTPGGALDGVGLEDWAAERLVGTPEQALDRLGRFAELGVEEVIVSAAPLPFAVYDGSVLDVFAETVIPKARSL